MRLTLILVASVAVLLVSVACGPAEPAWVAAKKAEASRITDADRQAAETKFKSLCFTCHGMKGAGDGPASQGLDPRPRNLQDPAWQESVTDEHIEKIILGGGLAVGMSAAMPGNPDLRGKPAVVAALREYIRKLGNL